VLPQPRCRRRLFIEKSCESLLIRVAVELPAIDAVGDHQDDLPAAAFTIMEQLRGGIDCVVQSLVGLLPRFVGAAWRGSPIPGACDDGPVTKGAGPAVEGPLNLEPSLVQPVSGRDRP